MTVRVPPSVGSDVHYVARGSADGVYPMACRAAKVTETEPMLPTCVGLMVINPEGIHFRPIANGGVDHDPGRGHPTGDDLTCLHEHRPGTWHYGTRI